MSKTRNYQSVGDTSDILTWNPKVNPDGSLKKKALGTPDETIEGFYMARKDNVGRFNRPVITIEREDGSRAQVWLDTVLEAKFNEIRLGMFVCVTYKGWELKKDAKDKTPAQLRDTDYFANWSVFQDLDEKPRDVAGYSAPAPIEQRTPPAAGHNQPTTSQPAANAGSKGFTSNSDDDLPF